MPAYQLSFYQSQNIDPGRKQYKRKYFQLYVDGNRDCKRDRVPLHIRSLICLYSYPTGNVGQQSDHVLHVTGVVRSQ
jgi:hypothetical protein